MSYINDIKNIQIDLEKRNLSHLGSGTSYERHLKQQEYNNNQHFISKYNIEEIDFNTEEYTEAFSALRDNISTNEYSSQNGDFFNISDEYAKYWTDNPLRFTKDDKTGSYLIEQMDSNGNWVGMGWTTADVYAEYADRVEKIINEIADSKNEIEDKSVSEPVIGEANNTNDVDDTISFKPEIPKNISEKLISSSFEDEILDENTIYRKFSDGTILSFDKEGKFIKIIETGTTDLDNKNSITDITNLQPEVKPLDEDNTFDDFDDFI